MNQKRSVSGMLFDMANVTCLIVFCFSILYPVWTIIVQSFSPIEEIHRVGLRIWVDKWSGNGWAFILGEPRVARGYANTTFRVAVGTAIVLLVTFSGAYALSKRTLPGRNWFTLLFVFTMFFGGGMIPTYLLIRSLGLIDTRWALVLPGGINVFYIIIARNFLMSIDQGLEDSAVVDGAGYWLILFKIIVPIAKPVIATVALWAAVGYWNEWFQALIYTNDKRMEVLQLLLREMLMELSAAEMDEFADRHHFRATIPPQSVQAAMILVTIGPIIVIYPFFQRYFVKGIMIGSLKG